MEYTTLFSVWLVAITGPCVVSWLMGDRIGAARTRHLLAAEGEPETQPAKGEAGWDQHSFRVPDWCVEGAIHPLAQTHNQPDGDGVRPSPRAATSFEQQAALAEERRQMRRLLSRSASSGSRARAGARLENWRAETRADPGEVLIQYERSVAALQRVNLAAKSQPAPSGELQKQRVRLA